MEHFDKGRKYKFSPRTVLSQRIVSEKTFERQSRDNVNVVLEEITFKERPYILVICKMKQADVEDSEYRVMFKAYSLVLGKMFYEKFIEFLKPKEKTSPPISKNQNIISKSGLSFW